MYDVTRKNIEKTLSNRGVPVLVQGRTCRVFVRTEELESDFQETRQSVHRYYFTGTKNTFPLLDSIKVIDYQNCRMDVLGADENKSTGTITLVAQPRED